MEINDFCCLKFIPLDRNDFETEFKPPQPILIQRVVLSCLKVSGFSSGGRMSDLSDALKRFKTGRPASPPTPLALGEGSEASEISEASEDSEGSEVSKLVCLYKSIFDRDALSDPATKAMRDDFTARWDRLDERRRKALVDKLLELKLLPEIVAKALVMFKGKMTRLM